MIERKSSKISKYWPYAMLVAFIIAVFFFRNIFVGTILNLSEKIYPYEVAKDLTQSEHEELESLRIENKVLKTENENLKQQYSISELEVNKSLVYMLMGLSNIYGDFYVTLPKNKTAYKGMNIFSSGNIVVGQVSEILPNFLKVKRLGQDEAVITDSLEASESLELRSLGSGLYIGTVSGGSKISLGDTIVLKGYPKAIVGTVVEITNNSSSINNVFVRTPYNINNKEIFYVLQ